MPKKRNEVIQILMDRDGMTEDEAKELIREVRSMVMEAIERGDFIEAEEIFMSELGLEPDYIFAVL